MARKIIAEEWRRVAGFPRYLVSSCGRIKNVEGKLLKHATQFGYARVAVWANGLVSHKSLARLVAEAFIGPCPPNLQVNHMDCNKKNNRADNLEYVTQHQNIRHAIANGRWIFGKRNGNVKLNWSVVRRMRHLYPKVSSEKLGKMFGVSSQHVLRVVTHKQWKERSQLATLKGT